MQPASHDVEVFRAGTLLYVDKDPEFLLDHRPAQAEESPSSRAFLLVPPAMIQQNFQRRVQLCPHWVLGRKMEHADIRG